MINIAPTFNDTYRSNGFVTDLLNNIMNDPFFGEDDYQHRDSSKVKVIEEAKRYIIQFPVPGYNRHNLQLEIQEDELIVKGNRNKSTQAPKTDEHSGNLIQLHSYSLPQDADPGHIKAVCQNGLLEVYVRKLRSASKGRLIPVRGGSMSEKSWSWGANLRRKLKRFSKLKFGRKG